MCGIVGYIGKDIEKIIISKLKKLEYRGYDSAGIAVGNADGYKVFKAKGEIKNLEKIIEITPQADIGIGHTRWATHGKPDEINAHPHISTNKQWALVHNGIIENYAEIKEKLIAQGMTFYSQTDSETIAKLLEYYEFKDGLESIFKTISALDGSYALAVLHNQERKIFFAKNKSPLYVALKNGEALLASDVICFGGFAEEYYVIEDGEFGFTDGKDLVIRNDFGKVCKTAVKLAADFSTEENVYDHFMIKEIYDTKNALLSNLEYYSVENNYKKLYDTDISYFDKVVLVGCGTAYHACLSGARFFREKINVDCFTEVASEFRYSHPKINEKTIVFLVSQSGETADTLAAYDLAHKAGAKTVAIVNVEYSTLAKSADVSMPIKAGVEVAVASTKAYSAQVLTLYIAAMIFDAKKKGNKVCLDNINDLVRTFEYGNIALYKEIAETLRYQQKIFMIGRGADYCSANEASLKIKETSYINSDTYYAGELKHGFLALIDDMTYVVVFATEKDVLSKTLSNAEEAYSRGAKLILFTCFDDIDKEFKDKCFFIVKIRNTGCGLQAIENIVPWQLIAYYTSVSKGINPDKPRNLAKSVTVE